MNDDHNCCCGHEGHSHENKKHDWEEHLKSMNKEELSMKKEKLEKKLSLINKLLKEKK